MPGKAASASQAEVLTGNWLRASSAERLFVAGGILLILAGMIFGDIFAVFILHPNADRIGQQLLAAANAVSAHRPELAKASFSAIGGMLENRGTKVDAHAHIIDFGYIAFVLALIQPWVGLAARRRRALAAVFMFGATLLPAGVFLIHYVGLAYSPWRFIGWASVAADLGGLLVVAVCAAELFGIWLFFSQPRSQATNPLPHSDGPASRLLLSGGTLLMLAGFLFGSYYAAFHLDNDEARETAILGRLIEQSATGSGSASEVVSEYGALQAEKAVHIAAHAHLIEFGVIAFLLGLVQPLVFLSDRWKLRWAAILLIGSFTLPLFVALEPKLGLLAGGIADIGGALVIISLGAMLAGLVRTTGRLDSAEGCHP